MTNQSEQPLQTFCVFLHRDGSILVKTLQTFCVFLHRDGSILVKTSQEQKDDPISMSRTGGYYAGYCVEAASKETAIWKASREALAMNYDRGLETLKGAFQHWLEEEDYTVEEDDTEGVEDACELLQVLKSGSPLEGLVKLEQSETAYVCWVQPRDIGEMLSSGWATPDSQPSTPPP